MFADLDFDNPEVVREMQDWGIWVSNELNLDGMRLDAIKHMNDQFIKHFLEAVRADRGRGFLRCRGNIGKTIPNRWRLTCRK